MLRWKSLPPGQNNTPSLSPATSSPRSRQARRGDSTADKPPYVGYYHFLCPSHEEVRNHLSKIVADLGNTANLDGIHLDYIRYPDVILPVALWKKYNLIQNEELPQFDFCYCEVCRKAFKKQTGEDPLRMPDPTTNFSREVGRSRRSKSRTGG